MHKGVALTNPAATIQAAFKSPTTLGSVADISISTEKT